MDAYSLHQITSRLDRIITIGEALMAIFERLEASVSQIETVSESIETLVHGIAAELRELKDRSDAGLAEFADRLDARAASMTSTVFEHTQVEPDGPVEDDTEDEEGTQP